MTELFRMAYDSREPGHIRTRTPDLPMYRAAIVRDQHDSFDGKAMNFFRSDDCSTIHWVVSSVG